MNMSFYSALQLDQGSIKKYISSAKSQEEKKFFIKALLTRDILLVSFAIIFISLLTKIFGSSNSTMAVVIFCALLSIRFVDFGYKVKDSLMALGIVFSILLISPQLMQKTTPLIGLVINFISIFVIILTTCEKPEMGNAGLYMFGYIVLSRSSISQQEFIQRAELTLLGFVICGIIMYIKHHHKHKDRTIVHVFKDFDIHSAKGQWQLQITMALSLLFFIGSFFDINKFIWVGFACSSLLSSYPIDIHDRLLNRAMGAVIGSALFGIIYCIMPPSMYFLFGPISGLCLGLCSSYRSQTICNCFGALIMAAAVYGVHESIFMRIANNLIGIIFGYVFFHFFQLFFVKYGLSLIKKYCKKKTAEINPAVKNQIIKYYL